MGKTNKKRARTINSGSDPFDTASYLRSRRFFDKRGRGTSFTIQCKAREMVAMVKTSKIFNGKVYSKARPNSCVTDVVNSLDFQIRMAYHELECDVKQENLGQFSTDIVIQHHDMIVTNQDLGLSVHCQYDLANRSVSNGVQLEVDGREVETSQSQLATVSSPNVTMRITDRVGDDVFTAQVGDPLALRFEIVDSHSPYEIFVRELVAMDGVDSSEILLVDSHGCPTDRTIMGPLHKVNEDGKVLHAPFDAFKFPTSEIVQFKALVTPCLPTCDPRRYHVGTSYEPDVACRRAVSSPFAAAWTITAYLLRDTNHARRGVTKLLARTV
ncbi:hypothetical protein HPB48_006195 [Haemaphysalis longicornis]|uniref:ZP domain-containing protein n=1 Tax=Haemaphysalis longicornis TaxID=44386 RepID=A0A9J6FVJ9_HAELO|nr:hypothetical protein HPB48_006195 [Haemaphysalis longicornis]